MINLIWRLITINLRFNSQLKYLSVFRIACCKVIEKNLIQIIIIM